MDAARCFSPSTDGIAFTQITMSQLPPAATSLAQVYFVSDAPGGQSLVVSDGTSWRAFGRGAQFIKAVSDSTGVVPITFSPVFAAPPTVIVTLLDIASGTGTLADKVTNLTATGCTVTITRSQNLPSSILALSALANFSPFGNGNVAGVTAMVLAAPPTQ